MKRITILLVVLSFGFVAQAQDILGKWKTIDDDTGKAKSVVEIYKKDGKIYGKIVELLREGANPDEPCNHCKGDFKGKLLVGSDIIKGLEKDGNEYTDGTISDPESGKTYDAKIWVSNDDNNILKVRGYVAFFYRTQEWIRVKG
ncbi:MAG: DUF2147 domain-containing protein [Bacteroidota bacterium]